SKLEVFYYIYGLLNSQDYINKYQNDLIKDIPRVPKVKSAENFIHIGEKLMDLHLNYEKTPLYKGASVEYKDTSSWKVIKMRHPKFRDNNGKLIEDKSIIIFNSDITIKDIPKKAYEYVINGKSAIEWIMDQYQVKTDRKSGIVDDPNLYSDDEKYIFNLLLRIINVSVKTVDLVSSLPPLEIVEE